MGAFVATCWRFALLAAGLLFLAGLCAGNAIAAAGESVLDGAKLSLAWALPFGGILGSLAILPIIAPGFWHRNYGLVSLFWALAFLVPLAISYGIGAALHELVHVLLLEYIPFIALIGSLFTIAGGIYVGSHLRGSPQLNVVILVTGMLLASFVGTTGAAMILIRPIIRANTGREHNVHVVIFFIFLVCNIGGALTPLGDPPLFLGYLHGIDFFWPLKALWLQTIAISLLVLTAFFALDLHYFRKEAKREPSVPNGNGLIVGGLVNVPLVVALVASVAISGSNELGKITIYGTKVAWMSLLRDAVLITLALASLWLTPSVYRKQNDFNWAPVLEVAKLFAAIFITIVPAIAILKAGPQGSLAPILALLGSSATPNNAAYFWLTGILSSFLDNAPTYLVFFNAAGGDPETLMRPMATTLTAISAGAVFMGANTYIGNAPNFMVKAIAEQQGVKMPGFFGFMLWSGVFLVPAYLILTLLFYR